MGFFQDFAPLFHRHTLTFVDTTHEVGNIVSFLFKCDEPLVWKAGQHGVFSFPRKMDGGSWRGFSVASHPGEGFVRISTRIQEKPSAFKQALLDLKPDDQISMRGPFGPFYLDGSRRPVVFIAGGIGITPYRSMILDSDLAKDRAPEGIRLLYADDSRQYAYRNELDDLTLRNPVLKVDYLTSADLPDALSQSARDAGTRTAFYISGPIKMVKSIKQHLIGQGIPKKNIRHEMFLGL